MCQRLVNRAAVGDFEKALALFVAEVARDVHFCVYAIHIAGFAVAVVAVFGVDFFVA